MNKYNIRAIRNELDTYIRYASWKKFRLRLKTLQPDLAGAVIESRGHSKTTTLHLLCRCCNSVPLDILKAVLQVCSPHLFLQRSPITPLAMALGHYHHDRQASLTALLDLIQHDTTANKESLYMKDKAGDTPILHVVRQKQNCDSIDWDVVHLLVQHDNDSKQTLLIPSKKKQRVPLWYVVANHQDEDDCSLVEYMLLQTYHALEIQQGRKGMDSILFDAMHQHHCKTGTSSSGFFPNESSSSSTSCGLRHQDYMVLFMRAILACAHLLGSKNTMKICSTFQQGKSGEGFPWQQQQFQDSDGNTLLHHACRAVESDIFLEQMPGLGSLRGSGSWSLLRYLIDGYPQALFMSNIHGQLPLHLAIQAQKSWEFLRHMCCPQAILQMKTKEHQLALHLALNRYSSTGYFSCREIMELWNGYPEAVAIVDGKTGLFAFQLVAAVGLSVPEKHTHSATLTKTNSKRKDEEQQAIERDQLSLIYFFLRACPEVILLHR